MSLRGFAAQAAVEDQAFDELRRRLGRGAIYFDHASPVQVRDAVDCPKHGSRLLGQWCGNMRGTDFVCLDRRIAAAEQAAEVA